MKKYDWILELYYDVDDLYDVEHKTKTEILKNKSVSERNEYIDKKVKKKFTEGPGGGFGWIEYWTLKKIKIYRIEKHLCKIIDC